MSIVRHALWVLCLVCPVLPAQVAERQPASATGPGLGRPVTAGMLAARSIYPDGRGLPDGSGTASGGRAVYLQKCARCHGERGEGGPGGHLVGRGPLTGADADKTVGNYWPYATTIFDFTRRAMPMDAPGSLSADETYALTAYLLYMNEIIGADAEMNARSLPAVAMPNRDGFVWIDAPQPGALR